MTYSKTLSGGVFLLLALTIGCGQPPNKEKPVSSEKPAVEVTVKTPDRLSVPAIVSKTEVSSIKDVFKIPPTKVAPPKTKINWDAPAKTAEEPKKLERGKPDVVVEEVVIEKTAMEEIVQEPKVEEAVADETHFVVPTIIEQEEEEEVLPLLEEPATLDLEPKNTVNNQINDHNTKAEEMVEPEVEGPEAETAATTNPEEIEDIKVKEKEEITIPAPPVPWGYGTAADSYLSSNPTKLVSGNVQSDPFAMESDTAPKTPAPTGEKEGTPARDPFGGSDDSQPLAKESSVKATTPENATIPKTNSTTAVPVKTGSETTEKTVLERMEELNVQTENLSTAEKYLMNEAQRSPVRAMESIGTLVQLQKPILVKKLLLDFMQKELKPEDYALISKRVPSASLTRLASDPDYVPNGAAVVQRIVDGTKAYYESKTQIEDALEILLTSKADSEKEAAMQSILRGREVAVDLLLHRLIESNDEPEVAEVCALLYRMGEDSRHALIEILLLRNEASVRAAGILAKMGKKTDARLIIPMLYDPALSEEQRGNIANDLNQLIKRVPGPQEAAVTIYTEAMNYFRGKVPFRTDVDGNVKTWVFKEGDVVPTYTVITEPDASRYHAEKYARAAAFLDQNNAAYRTLWLASFFELKGQEAGIDVSIYENQPLVKGITDAYSLKEIEVVLRFSMTQDHPIASRVATELLGSIGTAEALLYKPAASLVKAAGFSDRRVRFAALEAIMKLDPKKPYPGSSIVSESLVYFTKSGGIKRAVVAAPKINDSKEIASMLLPLGYVSETATTGSEAMKIAANSSDTELMMIDSRTPSRGLNFLIQDMYLDNRTHDVPLAVYAAAGEETKGAKAVVGAVRARAYYRPHDEETVRVIIENLMKETGVEHVPLQLRLEAAKKSIIWVTKLFDRLNIYKFENIEEVALQVIWTPELVFEAMDLVALIKSVNGQLMLTGIASESLNPMDRRLKAVDAFEISVKKHGLLLRGRQVLNLYDYYNASAAESKESQALRGRLLDIVEVYAASLATK